MKMSLKDHEKIGAIVLKECAHFKDLSNRFYRVADDCSERYAANIYFNYAQAYDLIWAALRALCKVCDFDCVCSGDEDE